MIGDRDSGDAGKLKEVKAALLVTKQESIKWIAQEHVEPEEIEIIVSGEAEKAKLLHRVYWVQDKKGEVSISLEGFACDNSQYSRSKGKINAGTGCAVPFIIKK